MNSNATAHFVGEVIGGSLDGAGDADRGYSMRGGRMLTTDNYECTWDLFKSIPSLAQPGRSVFEETLAFIEKHVTHAMARLVDSRRAKAPVASMGFSMHDRLEFSRIETLGGVKRTVLNQYDSLVMPLQRCLEAQGVRIITGCTAL